MKTIFSICAATALVAASCNSNPETTTTAAQTPVQDTTGLAAYQQWKAQNELNNTTQYNALAAPATQSSASRSTTNRSTGSSSSGTTSSNSSSSNTAQAPEKKGWSKAAKGAVIGGVAGAAGGAVINKQNRSKGAIIGGVLGAGAGYGIGRHKDKKDGRY
jgi:hypothetical protein